VREGGAPRSQDVRGVSVFVSGVGVLIFSMS
jgi:hypothetical protein